MPYNNYDIIGETLSDKEACEIISDEEAGKTLSDEEAEQLMQKYDHLFDDPNIVTMDYCIISNAKEGKEKTPRRKLCIGVIKINNDIKLPEIAVYETSTKRIEVPVHVFEEGEIKALAYEGGSAIKNEVLDSLEGSVGVNTIFNGTYRLLSCAHVLTEFDDANIGNQRRVKVCPSKDEPFQLIPVTIEGHARARVYDMINPSIRRRAEQDLAWAKITAADGLPSVKEIGSVSGIRKPILNETVTLFGAYSQEQFMNIPIIGNNVRLTMPFNASDGKKKFVFFRGLWKLDLRKTEKVLMPGDSGTAIIAEVDKAIVGILVCGNLSYAHFCALEL